MLLGQRSQNHKSWNKVENNTKNDTRVLQLKPNIIPDPITVIYFFMLAKDNMTNLQQTLWRDWKCDI